MDAGTRTRDVAGVGVAVGAGAQAIVQVAGDLNYHPVRLRAPLRTAFAPLLEDRGALFAGRDAELLAVARFLHRPEGGYLVISAPAGYGKTSVAAAVARSAAASLAYHFFSPLYGADGLGEELFLRNLVEQMGEWHGRTDEAPTGLAELRAVFHRYLTEPLEGQRALLIDGLDEVRDWRLAPYLSRRLPLGMHVVLTVRDVGQDWRSEYGLPADQVTTLELGALGPAEVADVLRAAGVTPDPDLLEAVLRVTAAPGVAARGTDPFHVRLVAEDLGSGRLAPGDVEHREAGLEAYLQEWWEEIRAAAGEAAARDLLGTLTVALGPIRRVELEAINPSLVDEWEADRFADVLQRVRRFVVGGEDRGYALVHPRLRAYMAGRLKTGPYEQRVRAFCAAWPEHHAAYALEHYASHLAAEARYDELAALLAQEDEDGRNAWYAARAAAGQVEGYLADVRLAWRRAEAAQDAGMEVRCAVMTASVGSLARNVPPALAAALVAGGQWTLEQALGYARRVPHPSQRAETFVALLPLLDGRRRERAVAEAVVAVRATRTPEWRASALAGLADDLHGEERDELYRSAVTEAFSGWPTIHGPPTLRALGPHLRGALLDHARAGVDRAASYAALLPWTSGSLVDEAIAAALRDDDLNGIAALVPQLPPDRLEPVLDHGFALAVHARDGQRLEWLRAVVRLDAARERAHALEFEEAEHRAAADLLLGRTDRVPDLSGLRLELGEDLVRSLTQAVSEADLEAWWLAAFPDGNTVALKALAPRLPDHALASVLERIATVADPAWRRQGLHALAPRLDAPLLRRALAIAQVIGDEEQAATALAALAAACSDGGAALAAATPSPVAPEALPPRGGGDDPADAAHLGDDEVLAILAALAAGELHDDEALPALADIAPERLEPLVQATLEVTAPERLARALAELLRLTPGAPVEGALAWIRRLEEPAGRLNVLSWYIPALPRAQQWEAISEAWSAVCSMPAWDHIDFTGLLDFAALLPAHQRPPLLSVALRLAGEFPADEDGLPSTLRRLVELLPAAWVPEGIERIRALAPEDQRDLLVSLADSLDRDGLERLIEAIRDLPAELRDHPLAAVSRRLEEPARAELLGEAMQGMVDHGAWTPDVVVAVLEHSPERFGDVVDVLATHPGVVEDTLAAWADVLPEAVVPRALTLVRAAPSASGIGLAALSRRLAPAERTAVLEEAWALAAADVDFGRVIAVAAATPREQRAEAFARVMRHITDNYAGGWTYFGLQELVPHLQELTPAEQRGVWAAGLSRLAGARPTLLEHVQVLAPVLQSMAGDRAVLAAARAIAECRRAWP